MIEKAPYTVATFELIPTPSDVMISGELDEIVLQRLHDCIEIEAPITRALLLKRVINSFDIHKVGWRVNQYFDRMLGTFDSQLVVEMGVPVYHSANEKRDCFRPGTKDIRFSHQIPPSEAAYAIVSVLERVRRKLRRKALYPLFYRELGYMKSGSDLDDLFSKSLKWAFQNGLIKRVQTSTYYVERDSSPA